MERFKVLSLFAGIGGFDLGLERTGGFETVAFCEIDAKCRKVLAKHWPNVRQYDDVRELTGARLAADGIAVDAIVGGFPCQDLSLAGKGAGLEGERSGLFFECARLIGEIRPSWVVLENVSALLTRGLDRVLGTLAALGYDAEWHCIPASAVGAPHRRDRIWIIAYPNNQGKHLADANSIVGDERRAGYASESEGGQSLGCGGSCEDDLADANHERSQVGHAKCPEQDKQGQAGYALPCSEAMAHANQPRLQGRLSAILQECAGEQPVGQGGTSMADAGSEGDRGSERVGRGKRGQGANPQECGRGYRQANVQWLVEPNVGRVANGVPGRVDRLKQLGNAVVPQIPELIGRAILEASQNA